MDEAVCPGCQALRERVAGLEARVGELTRLLEEALRAGKRQAAPFAKRIPAPKPQRPGRKAGNQHGTHGHRLPLPDDHIDEHLHAELPAACPDCGGPVGETHHDTQDQTELPLRPLRRRFHIHCGQCRACGRRVRGRHPQQTSHATGAAGSQVGPQAQALIVHLNKDAGLSHGKTAAVLQHLGLPLTRGASAQIMLRAARRLAPVYQAIRRHLPSEEHLTPDETGWRIGGHPAWLHAWVGAKVTCFAIDPKRGAEVLAEVIGWDWSGVMTHDGCPSYDRFTEAVHQQCVAHVCRRAHDLEAVHGGAARVFPRQVIDLFQDALRIRDRVLDGRDDAAVLLTAHDQSAARLLALTERPRANAANERLAKHLYTHGEQWLQFLIDPHTPATNHRAERALRGPIVNRKVWGGNRTPAGAHAQGILQSTMATCRQHAISFLHFLSDTLRGLPRTLLGSTTPQLA